MQQFDGTTIVSVRRNNSVVIGGDGQVSLGDTIMKGNARKVRRLYKDRVIAGFAGGTADAFMLFELFEGKLEKHGGQMIRAAVELAKEWRSDRALRRLEALLSVADNTTFTGCIVILAITGSLSLFFLVGAGYVLRIEEITSIFKKLALKIKSR